MTTDLTFRSFRNDGKDYWHVSRSGDYATDCATGRAHADELVRVMRAEGNPGLLHHVVEAIALGGQFDGGVEVGFFTRLAESSIR